MSTIQKAIDALSPLTRDELARLRSIIDGLLSDGLLDENAGKGHIEYKFVVRSGKQYGPYKHRRIWKDGKLTDEYLGRATMTEYNAWKAEQAVQVHEQSTKITRLVKFEDVSALWDKSTRDWREPDYVYIGRGKRGTTLLRSIWANPYRVQQIQTEYGLNEEQARSKVIALYREWIQTQPDLLAKLPELQGKTLVCHCAPAPCHGDVLIELLSQLILEE